MSALKELIRAIISFKIYWVIAVDDVISKYRRTLLGPAWLIIAQIAWIGGIYLLHAEFMGTDSSNYLSYLASGLAVWGLISGITSDAPIALVRAKGFIESYPLPIAIHLLRSVAGGLITFAHMILVFFATFILERNVPSITMLAAIPGLILVVIYGLGVELFLSTLGSRFRDIGPAVSAALNLTFIMTPIFWVPSEAQAGNLLLVLNPYYHLVEVVRQPLMGSWPGYHWVGASLAAFAALSVGLVTYVRMRSIVVYWL